MIVNATESRQPFDDQSFNGAISLGCRHNHRLFDVKGALVGIERIDGNGYVLFEGYRDNKAPFNFYPTS